MQHGYKTQHYTVTALHTLNNTVALDISKAFDTINIHTLIRKLLQTNVPGTIIKFIASYIKGRKAYTTTHPDNVNLKLAFHKAASFHPHYLTFTPQTYRYPVHRFRSWPTQMTAPSQARVPGQNKLTLNPDKTTCTLFTPDTAEYTSNLS